MTHRDDIRAAADIVAAVLPILAGKSPDVVGAALVEILAIFIAGHAPELRDEILLLHCKAARELVPIVEAEAGGPWIRQ